MIERRVELGEETQVRMRADDVFVYSGSFTTSPVVYGHAETKSAAYDWSVVVGADGWTVVGDNTASVSEVRAGLMFTLLKSAKSRCSGDRRGRFSNFSLPQKIPRKV